MSNGLLILLYFVLTLILVLLSVMISYNFLRYRFQGDHTVRFLTVYAIAFVAIFVLSLVLVRWSDPNTPAGNEINGFSF